MSRQGECPHGWALTYEPAPEYGEGWMRPLSPNCALCGGGRFAAGLPFKPGPDTRSQAPAAKSEPAEPADPALDGF